MNEGSLEKRLQNLVNANTEANRTKWALDWKKQGKKVIGVASSYVPHEIIYAAGMLPWRVTGTWSLDISPAAAVHRPSSTDPFYAHILDARVKGLLDFLDGAVFTNLDDDMKRLYDVWEFYFNTPFSHMMFIPHHSGESAQVKFSDELSILKTKLETFGGKKITDKSLIDAIKEYNTMRSLLKKVYELRKQEKPALSGAEVLGITTAAQVMPVTEFNKELEALLPYLQQRTLPAGVNHGNAARIMIVSDALDNPAFIKLIEDTGATVVMDNMDTGSRWFWKDVDMTAAAKNPVKALAVRYITRPACPRMFGWDEQIQQTIDWAKEYKVNGVVDFAQINNFCRQFLVPGMRKALQDAKIPTLSITRDYVLTGAGQLKSRLEAFTEVIGGM